MYHTARCWSAATVWLIKVAVCRRPLSCGSGVLAYIAPCVRAIVSLCVLAYIAPCVRAFVAPCVYVWPLLPLCSLIYIL